MTSRHVRGDDGQLAPLASIFVVVSLVSLGLLFLQFSRATDLRGGAQTAADAAALAAADDYAEQGRTGEGELPPPGDLRDRRPAVAQPATAAEPPSPPAGPPAATVAAFASPATTPTATGPARL